MEKQADGRPAGKEYSEMKNIIALVLAMAMMLSFAACATKDSGSASPNDVPDAGTTVPTATPTNTPVITPEPTPDTAPSTEPENGGEDMNGNMQGNDNVSTESIWNAIYDEYGDTFPVTEAVPADSLKDITGIDPEKLESFVFQFPMMNVSASEFFIAKCKEGQLESVKEEVMAHHAALTEQWSQYLPEQLKLVENYVLETADNYIFFAVAEKAEDAAEIFKGYFK